MSSFKFIRALLLTFSFAIAAEAYGIDIVSMYRGSCQVDTGVILRVTSKSVTYLSMTGVIKKIPRYEIIGIAGYTLPRLPIRDVEVQDSDADIFTMETYRDGKIVPLAEGWPIEYNNEHIQVLSLDGVDQLVPRNDIWSVHSRTPPKHLTFKEGAVKSASYKLRHPLSFERCPDNITPGSGEPIPLIPQLTLDNPIAIKRYHDHLREGYTKVKDYEDRQRFYAIPRYYPNRTILGTWSILGSRYANVGARQVNFLPLVQDEFSEGPFGFQRIVRSGVAPLSWGLHEEPTVQLFYGLKADYIHLEIFFDPTAPLIGSHYDWSKDQLNSVDDRLVEKGGLEFGFDVGDVSLFFAYTEGNLGIRAHDYFDSTSFGLFRWGLSYQYNYYKASFYIGSNDVNFEESRESLATETDEFRFMKLLVQAPITPRLSLRAQLIERQLNDHSDPAKAPVRYSSVSDTAATQWDYDLNYRWTVYALAAAERQNAHFNALSGDSGSTSKIFPKLAGGVTVAF